MICETHSSRNQRKRALREVCIAETTQPTRNTWSVILITFARRDHTVGISNIGVAALVLDPIIDGFRMLRVLMDGGSSLNLIYAETLKKMQFDESRILPSKTTFKGIIPGKEVRCTRRVTLDMVFGTPDNYRMEALSFNIVLFRSEQF